MSLSFFLRFLRRFVGSVRVWVFGGIFSKVGSVISHFANFSAASSIPGNETKNKHHH